MSRGKTAIINIAMNFAQEIVAVICGLVLPRLILSVFGSEYNGLVSSITQFLSCATLLRAGIGGATRAALYKPLATHDNDKINSIVKATDLYMRKVGFITVAAVLVFAVIYPFFVSGDFTWVFSFSLFLIIGISTLAENFLGVTYFSLLQADQRIWVSSILRCICYLINTVVAVILIKIGAPIHIVECGSAVIYALYPIVQSQYVKGHYHLKKDVKPDNGAIRQRWDAFWQQVALFVMNNTDIMVLTIFSNLKEVSVYSVYNLVIRGLTKLVNTVTNSLEAPFGNMIAKNETVNLKTNFEVTEMIIYSICTIIYTTAIAMVLSFVKIYTNGINDADYIRPTFAYIILIAQFFSGIRITYSIIVQAAGHYRQTRNGAIMEPIINIVISIILVIKFGLIGVAIGTLVATIFRTVQYSTYVCKNIVQRNQFITLRKILLSLLEGVIVLITVNLLHLGDSNSFFIWILKSSATFCISSGVVFLGCVCFYNYTLKIAIKKAVSIIHR